MNKLISVGKIINFHGIKGEVKLGYSAGKEDLIKSLKEVYVFINDEKKLLDVEYVRFHKNFALVKFKQLNSINDVMLYKGLLVHIYKDSVKSHLEEDEYLIADLEGLDVFDTDGNKIGTVDVVGENKASNLICVKKPDMKTFLVPFVKELVPVVDLGNKKIVIKLLDGMDE